MSNLIKFEECTCGQCGWSVDLSDQTQESVLKAGSEECVANPFVLHEN